MKPRLGRQLHAREVLPEAADARFRAIDRGDGGARIGELQRLAARRRAQIGDALAGTDVLASFASQGTDLTHRIGRIGSEVTEALAARGLGEGTPDRGPDPRMAP